MAFFAFGGIAYNSAAAPNNSAVSEIVTVDLDGDHDLDLISARFFFPPLDASIPVEVLLNDGTGNFTDGSSALDGSAPQTTVPREIVVADFNGDGEPDFFIADHGYDADPFPGFQNQLLLSSPDGYVDATAASLPLLSDFSHSTTAADIDHDGDADILVGNLFRARPYILINDGDGVFTRVDNRLPAANANLNKHTYTTSLFADFNNDLKPDLFLGGDIASSSVVLRNNGAGKFVPIKPKLPAKPFGIKSITLDSQSLDINGDGRQDIVAVYTRGQPFYQDHAVQILINKGGFKFVNQTAQRLDPFEGGGWIKYLHFVDFNNDGALDIITEPSGGGTESEIRINDGDGVFFTPLHATQSFTGQAVEFGDFDGDTLIDAVAWGGDHGQDLLLYLGEDDQNYPLNGDADPNTLHGDAFDNTMSAGEGSDTVFGGAGNDSLDGGDNDDTLNGGSGDDLLTGGLARDVLTGGLGADVFDFNDPSESPIGPFSRDTIVDFRHAQGDKIDLAGIDANAITLPDDEAFTFIGRQKFHHVAGELHYVKKSGFLLVEGDTNGDGTADFQIEVHGAAKLVAADFVL